MRIGILSMQHVRNYGSFLQAYALKTSLESFGHQCEFVDIEQGVPLPGLERNMRYLVGMAFKRYFNWSTVKTLLPRRKYTKIYQKRFDNEFLPELGIYKHTFEKYDLVVIGSDEVFNFNQHTSYGFTPQLYGDVRNAKKAGLLIHACYMVGNEGETKETMQDTLKLALKLNTDTAQFFPLMPYPGTEAYTWAKSNGYIKGDYNNYNKENGDHNTVLNMDHLTTEEMNEFCDLARKKYYLRPRYIMHRLWIGLRDPEDLKRSLRAFGRIKGYLFRKIG